MGIPTVRVAAFEEIEGEFLARVARVVWCSLATADARDRVRSRVVHPIWEGATGWVASRVCCKMSPVRLTLRLLRITT